MSANFKPAFVDELAIGRIIILQISTATRMPTQKGFIAMRHACEECVKEGEGELEEASDALHEGCHCNGSLLR